MRAPRESLPVDSPSVSHEFNPKKDPTSNFIHMKINEIEGGALREGGAHSFTSKESLGLLAQYAGVGLIYGTLPYTITPFLTYYLNMEGTQTTSARTLLVIPWSIKVFIGMISDCFPIGGYRRRPYMVFGWALCAFMLFVMALMPLGKPYFTDPSVRAIRPEDYTADINRTINVDAPSTGGKYIVMMMFASLGYLIADVAADAVVVEYAQREPLEIRGQTQTAIYTVRTFFNIFSNIFLAFGMVSYDYGGDYESGMSFPQLMLVLAVMACLLVPISWFFIHERRSETPIVKYYLFNLWEFIQTRAAYQIIAYMFFSSIFSSFNYVAADPINAYWVSSSNTAMNLSGIFVNLVFGCTMAYIGRNGLHWNWKTMTAYSLLAYVLLDAFMTMLVTWNVTRHEWFWNGIPILQQIPSGIGFITSTYVIVELAGENNEGAIYGLMTSCINLAQPFASSLTKNVNAAFSVSNDDILNDSREVRRDVTLTILISYAMKLLSLAFLPLLPAQKAETQELIRTGESSRKWGIFTLVYLSFALVWSIVTNLLSVFESTSCLVIAGGDGC